MMFEKIDLNIKKAANKGIVIISDMGINYDVEDLCYDALGRFNEMKWKVVWVDHHQWSKGIMKRIGQLATVVHAGPMRKCAAELMHEYLLPGNRISKQLSEMAHKTDFMIEYQSVSHYTEIIQYYKNFPIYQEKLCQLAKKLAAGILWNARMQSDHLKYKDAYKMERKKSLEYLRVINIEGLNVAFVKVSNYINTSLFSAEIFKLTAADLALMYNENGKVSIRRNNVTISCRSIASLLESGGGHDFAAGGELRKHANSDAMRLDLENIVRKCLRSNR